MTPVPLQLGQAPSGVGAEQRRGPPPFGLRERLADRVEQPGVGRRVAASRAADSALVDRDHARAPGDLPVNERAFAGAGDPGDDDKHPERDVDVDVAKVARPRPADLQLPGGLPHRVLQGGPVVQMPTGERAAGAHPSTVPSKQTVPPAVPAPGPRSTT